MLHWDWLSVNLETLALVSGDGTGEDQQLGKQEHVQLLPNNQQSTLALALALASAAFHFFSSSGLAHRAALVPQLAVTQQALALLQPRVPLPVVQVLQLVDVVLTLGLALLHVDVGQNSLDDGDLRIRTRTNASLPPEMFTQLDDVAKLPP